MVIERLTTGDGERLRVIRLRSLRDSPDAFATTFEEAEALAPETWNRQLEHLATFVASAPGADLGMVRAMRDEQSQETAYVISMWVAPEARCQGIGSALLDAVVQWARAQGLTRLLLDVTEANAPAIALYTRKGFVRTGASGVLPPPRNHVREIQLAMSL